MDTTSATTAAVMITPGAARNAIIAERSPQLADVDLVRRLEHEARQQDREDQLGRDVDLRPGHDDRQRRARRRRGRPSSGSRSGARRARSRSPGRRSRMNSSMGSSPAGSVEVIWPPSPCAGRGRAAMSVAEPGSAGDERRAGYPSGTERRAGMDLGLDGRRALVGGGASGIGNGIAEVLAAEGARVALVGRTAARVEAEAARLGGSAVVADLSTPDGPAAAVDAAVAAFGGLDLLVVNTGGPPGGTFDTLSEADWEQAIDGTLQSVLRLLRAALPHLREGRDPSILIILSSSARMPIPALTTSNLIRPGLVGPDQVADRGARADPDQRPGARPDLDRPHRLARQPPGRGGRRHARGDRGAHAGDDPARPLRRDRGDRPGRGVPAVAGGVVRDRRHRPGGRRDDPRPAVGRSSGRGGCREVSPRPRRGTPGGRSAGWPTARGSRPGPRAPARG